MPNVVSTLSRTDHAALKKRAQEARRSMGAQLAFEAFAFLKLQPPAYLSEASPDAGSAVLVINTKKRARPRLKPRPCTNANAS